MPVSIHKKNEEILRQKTLLETALKEAGENVLDKDDPYDRDAETIGIKYNFLDRQSQHLLNTVPLLNHVPLPSKSKFITKRTYLISEYSTIRLKLKTTAERRIAYGDITAVAFGTQAPSPSGSVPSQIGSKWNINIILNSQLSSSATWKSIQYTNGQLMVWWAERRSRSLSTDDPAWCDMRALCRAVVYLMETIESDDVQISSVHTYIKDAGEKIRVMTIKLVALLTNYPDQSVEVAKLFEDLLSIVFAAYCIVNALQSSSSCGWATRKLRDVSIERIAEDLRALCEQMLQCTSDLTANIQFRHLPMLQSISKDTQDFVPLTTNSEITISDCVGGVALETGLVQTQEQFRGLLGKRNASEAAKVFDYVDQYLSMKKNVFDMRAFESLGLQQLFVASDMRRRLGEGSFSVVDEYFSMDGMHRYAVKVATCQAGLYRTLNRVGREASVWRRLSHPNVQELLGYCLVPSSPYPALVMDVCLDNLGTYLEIHPSLDKRRKLMFVKDIARGMDYRLFVLLITASFEGPESCFAIVHSEDIAHGDLRRANVLVKPISVSPGSRAVLSDFGVAYHLGSLHDPSRRTTCMDPTVNQKTNDAWLAPEFISHDTDDDGSFNSKEELLFMSSTTVTVVEVENPTSISFAGDVYAFGCVVLEVMLNEAPFANVRMERVKGLKRKGALPAARVPGSEDFYDFLVECWSLDPHARPDSRRILEAIGLLLENTTRAGARLGCRIICY